MTEMNMVWIFLIPHVVACGAIWLCCRFRWLPVERIYLPLVVLVPFWGALCVLLLTLESRPAFRKRDREKKWIREELFENIFRDAGQEDTDVVPLEEALILNSSRQKRKLMLDVLNDEPEAYIDLLNEARLDDDVEVVHYATTAMAEVSKDYDIRLQSMKLDYERDPEDRDLLDRYCALLGKYISLGLIRGQPLLLQRRRYEQLLEKKGQTGLTDRELKSKAENELELQQFDKALDTLYTLEALRPRDEEVWLLELKYHVLLRQGEKIRQLIAQIERSGIVLSSKGQEVLDFWKNKR